MIASSGPWTIQAILGTIAVIVTVIGGLAWAIFGVIAYRSAKGYYARRECLEYGVGTGLGVAAVALAVYVYAMWPLLPEYHQWRKVTGTVTSASSRMISDGKGMSQRYVLVVGGQPYGVDDTRAATVKPGQAITLACKRDYVYAGTSGYVCTWDTP